MFLFRVKYYTITVLLTAMLWLCLLHIRHIKLLEMSFQLKPSHVSQKDVQIKDQRKSVFVNIITQATGRPPDLDI